MNELKKKMSFEEMTMSDFHKLSQFIQGKYGIKLPESKKIMLQGRLYKRLKALNFENYSEYTQYVLSFDGKEEISMMVDAVSTNKTDFFREDIHFKLLQKEIFPEIQELKNSIFYRIWSAGCSSGEEAYTIAMIMMDMMKQNPGWDFSVMGSDISTTMLRIAKKAVYSYERIDEIPYEFRKKYLLKSKDRSENLIRIAPEIRSKVNFDYLNLLDDISTYPDGTFDIIFCRNTLIYFERDIQTMVVEKLLKKLIPEGFLIIGHSESLLHMDIEVEVCKPTIYRKIKKLI